MGRHRAPARGCIRGVRGVLSRCRHHRSGCGTRAPPAADDTLPRVGRLQIRRRYSSDARAASRRRPRLRPHERPHARQLVRRGSIRPHARQHHRGSHTWTSPRRRLRRRSADSAMRCAGLRRYGALGDPTALSPLRSRQPGLRQHRSQLRGEVQVRLLRRVAHGRPSEKNASALDCIFCSTPTTRCTQR